MTSSNGFLSRTYRSLARRVNSVRLGWAAEHRANKLHLERLTMSCNLCGAEGHPRYKKYDWREMTRLGVDLLRENVICPGCRSTARYRALGRVVEEVVSELRNSTGRSREDLVVLDTDPISRLQPFFRDHPGYSRSGFDPSRTLGVELEPGVVNVDLERTGLPDESLDLLISSDVLEHVVDDLASLVEARRVLRPGGAYVFTTPIRFAWRETETVACRVNGADLLLTAPHLHGDRKDPILAYRVYGADLLGRVREAGLTVERRKIHSEEHAIFGVDVIVACRPMENE